MSGRSSNSANSEARDNLCPFSAGKETVVFPGFDGGAEWGGSAVDPATGVLYVNANDIPWTASLTKTQNLR